MCLQANVSAVDTGADYVARDTCPRGCNAARAACAPSRYRHTLPAPARNPKSLTESRFGAVERLYRNRIRSRSDMRSGITHVRTAIMIRLTNACAEGVAAQHKA